MNSSRKSSCLVRTNLELWWVARSNVMTVMFCCVQTYSLAGLGSGVTEAIIVNPFEVVKVKMQSNRAHQSQAPSTW